MFDVSLIFVEKNRVARVPSRKALNAVLHNLSQGTAEEEFSCLVKEDQEVVRSNIEDQKKDDMSHRVYGRCRKSAVEMRAAFCEGFTVRAAQRCEAQCRIVDVPIDGAGDGKGATSDVSESEGIPWIGAVLFVSQCASFITRSLCSCGQ